MSKHDRRHYFVDRQVQGKLLGQLVNCWAVSLLSAGGLTVAGWIFITPGINGFVGPDSFMSKILPMVLVGMVASTLALPVMLWSMVRISHRFVGPMVRFKRHLREAADTGKLVPLHFRDDDQWHELAETFNEVVARIEAERLGSPLPDDTQHAHRAMDDTITSAEHEDQQPVLAGNNSL
ncbi:hypothetical protein [Aeoliella sp.]|uniref:hypothetical protein n=1 Tax=Aeoliella sp. TaxID=2795800 RepID=UPI003CCBD1E6